MSVMNLTKSSQPEETETVEVLASMRVLVDFLISSRSPATVPAVGGKEGLFYNNCIIILQLHWSKY